MCFGGGYSGTDPAEIERQRQARIAATVDKINQVFGQSDRESLYSSHRDNVYARNMEEYERQAADAQRKLKFALARAGLGSGSAGVDQRKTLMRNLNDAKLRVSDFADQAANNLRISDEDARLKLISQAQAGMNSSTAAQNAASQLALNAESASNFNELATLGDLFAGINIMQNQSQANAGKSAARSQYKNNDEYTSYFGGGSSGGTSGTTTKIG